VWRVFHTPHRNFYNKAAIWGGCVGALAPRDFHLPGPLKQHRGGHRFQNIAELQEVTAKLLLLQSPEFCVENIHLLTTRCDKCMNLQGYYVEK
jgi:hypothetical protein